MSIKLMVINVFPSLTLLARIIPSSNLSVFIFKSAAITRGYHLKSTVAGYIPLTFGFCRFLILSLSKAAWRLSYW
jgi:hypothetical protein